MENLHEIRAQAFEQAAEAAREGGCDDLAEIFDCWVEAERKKPTLKESIEQETKQLDDLRKRVAEGLARYRAAPTTVEKIEAISRLAEASHTCERDGNPDKCFACLAVHAVEGAKEALDRGAQEIGLASRKGPEQYARVTILRDLRSDGGEVVAAGSEGVIAEVLLPDAYLIEVAFPEPALVGGQRFDTLVVHRADIAAEQQEDMLQQEMKAWEQASDEAAQVVDDQLAGDSERIVLGEKGLLKDDEDDGDPYDEDAEHLDQLMRHELVREAFVTVSQVPSDAIKQRAQMVLDAISDGLTKLGDDLKTKTPFRAFIEGDGAVSFEWCLPDLRLGFGVETDPKEDGWWYVTKTDKPTCGPETSREFIIDLVKKAAGYKPTEQSE